MTKIKIARKKLEDIYKKKSRLLRKKIKHRYYQIKVIKQKLKIGITKIKIGYRKIEHKCSKNQGCQEKINSLKTGEPNLGSCHVTQSEQKKKHGKYFWLNFLKNPVLRHNTQGNAHVPLYTAAL